MERALECSFSVLFRKQIIRKVPFIKLFFDDSGDMLYLEQTQGCQIIFHIACFKSLKRYFIWPYKVRSNRMNIVREPLLLSIPKKVKEAPRTRLSGNKITSTKTFVRLKEFAKWKTTLNQGTLACYENLPIKTHLKKRAIFLCVTVKSPVSKSCNKFRNSRLKIIWLMVNNVPFLVVPFFVRWHFLMEATFFYFRCSICHVPFFKVQLISNGIMSCLFF